MKKILAIRNDRFGEFLLNIPALHALKETSPEIELHVMVAPAVEALAGAVPCIDKVWVRPAGPCPWWYDLPFIFRLRREKYDAAIVLNPSREAHHLVFWAGIPVRVGYSRKHHFLLTKTLKDQKYLGLKHEVDYNLELVGLLGAKTQDKTLALGLTDAFKVSVLRKFGIDPDGGMVAVHPWTSDPVKQWPLKRFKELVHAISAGGMGKIVIIGKPEEWHEAVTFAGENVIDLQGRTSLIEAAAVLSYCRCLVSCDSGPVHLASAVNIPVVALFRNDMPGKTPERWGPWGQGHVVLQEGSMEAITVAAVLTALYQMIRRL